ncbi:MAG: hypothetical protein NTV26_03650 [Caldiserica bacterium]|nr:hypothetical protein [Caldisericota bacterium]
MEQVRKILIILSTAEREKAIAGLMYAQNTHDNHWFDDVRVVLFGPFERLLAEDEEIRALGAEIFKVVAHPVACNAFAEDALVSDAIKSLGCEIDQVGGIISECIRNGYVPLVF